MSSLRDDSSPHEWLDQLRQEISELQFLIDIVQRKVDGGADIDMKFHKAKGYLFLALGELDQVPGMMKRLGLL